jgi:hypothetical protein
MASLTPGQEGTTVVQLQLSSPDLWISSPLVKFMISVTSPSPCQPKRGQPIYRGWFRRTPNWDGGPETHIPPSPHICQAGVGVGSHFTHGETEAQGGWAHAQVKSRQVAGLRLSLAR